MRVVVLPYLVVHDIVDVSILNFVGIKILTLVITVFYFILIYMKDNEFSWHEMQDVIFILINTQTLVGNNHSYKFGSLHSLV